MNKCDFDTLQQRRGTASVKWDALSDDETLPLWVADMDFRAPPEILSALHERVDLGVFGYALAPESWRQSLARWLAARHDWAIDTKWLVEATGVLRSLGAAIDVFCSKGDGIILQTPAYCGFLEVIRDRDVELFESPLLCVPSHGEGDFSYEMDFEDLERKASDPRAKLFLLCNPHNPAGRAWSADELRRAGEICRRHGVFLLSDEIHADLQMPGSRHVPYAKVAEGLEDTFMTFWSATKTFNLAGLHASVAVCANPKVRDRMRRMHGKHGTGYLNTFSFLASSVAWDKCAYWLDELLPYLHGNYLALLGFIRERMPRVRVADLDATYLAWLDVTALGVPSRELAQRLETEAKVKLSPGAMFLEPKGESFLRVNLASPRAMLMEALERCARMKTGESISTQPKIRS